MNRTLRTRVAAVVVGLIVVVLGVILHGRMEGRAPLNGRYLQNGGARLSERADNGRGGPSAVVASAGEADEEATCEAETAEIVKRSAENLSDADDEAAMVEAFDGLVDKWMEPVGDGVAMKDVEAFVGAFRQVPKARRDECVHRALNLIPDDNVALLAGVLMDKSMEREIVETVFHDLLNREEDVKRPILEQISKDKAHPCQPDAAWVLEVTGGQGDNAPNL